VPDVVIRVSATPASAGAATFTAGCGSADGTSSYNLSRVDAQSAENPLQVRLTVPASAAAGTTVSLTASASAPQLTSDAKTSVTVAVTAPPANRQLKAATAPATPAPATKTPAATSTAAKSTKAKAPAAQTAGDPALSASSLLTVPSASSGSSLAPGGSAASLFPTLNPTQAPAAEAAPSIRPAERVRNEGTRPMANTSALPEGTSAIGAQLVGLAALAVAFILAVTRLTLRRRPAAKPAADEADGKETSGNAG
jgi:ABC-2 type transport system ATP-binding protein